MLRARRPRRRARRGAGEDAAIIVRGARREPAEEDQMSERKHTDQGAPTDATHQDAGDGSLTGSVPAGLTPEQLRERAERPGRDDPGSE
jgi:hypothetical protein